MSRTPYDLDTKIIEETMREAVRENTVNISTKEVARRLSISEPAIFAHFKTKKDLIRAAFFKAWDTFNKPLIPVPPEQLTTSDIHYEFFAPMYDAQLKNKKEITFIVYYLGSTYYSQKDVFTAQKKRRDELKGILLRVYGPRPEEDLDVLITLFIEDFVRGFYDLIKGEIEDTEKNRRLIFSEVTLGINGFMLKSAELAKK